MKVFYVDEFGDHSLAKQPDVSPPKLKAGVSEWFLLAAVGVDDSSRKPLAQAIFDLKRTHFGDACVEEPWGDTEIKGRFLMRVSRSVASGNVLAHPPGYSCIDTQAQVAALLSDLGLVFARFRPTVFVVGVDKTRLLARAEKKGYEAAFSPLGVAYSYLQQRVSLMMDRVHEGEAALLVADQQTQHEAFFRSGEMHRTRDELTKNAGRRPNFSLVLDKPLWIDTALSTWDREILQLPDIVAYSVAECLARGAAPDEACYLWRHIRPTFALHWTTSQVFGAGVSVFPPGADFPEM